MNRLKTWTALLNREYLEHRIAFLYFPVGILALLILAAVSALAFNPPTHIPSGIPIPAASKIFEIGYLSLAAMWALYLGVVVFFYFGDAFSADRRNNSMFFWKSMPVSDLKILSSKFLAGTGLLPAVIFVMTLLSGIVFIALIYVAATLVGLNDKPSPFAILGSFGSVSAFVLLYTVLSILWYAPFFAWVGGLSAVFGRWSYVLAFMIPGLAAVVENIVFFRQGPPGGYVLHYLGTRSHFGLEDADYTRLINAIPFDFGFYASRLFAEMDWTQLGIGLVFAAIAIYAASEYRRRRIA